MTNTNEDTKVRSAAAPAATPVAPAAIQPAAEMRPQPMPHASAPAAAPAAPAAASTAPGGATGAQQPRQSPQPQGAAPAAPTAAPQRSQPGRFRRFVRSLFTHILFAGFSVASVLGYLYHEPILQEVSGTVCGEQVLGQWMPKGAATASLAPSSITSAARHGAAATVAMPVATAAVPAMVATTPATAKPAAEAAHYAPPQPATATPKPVAPPVAAAPMPAAPTASNASPVVTAAATPTAAPASHPAAPMVAPVPAAPAIVPAQPAATPAAAAPSLKTASLEEGLAAARRAFADGNPEAVASYAELAKRFPDNPDLTGELGNILYQQGKLAEAGELFFETGQRLIRRKQEARAACLADVLEKLSPEKARELAKLAGVACPSARQ